MSKAGCLGVVRVTQGHGNSISLYSAYDFLFAFHSNFVTIFSILHHFRHNSEILVENPLF